MNGQSSPTEELPSDCISISFVATTERRRQSILIPGSIEYESTSVGAHAFIDCGASASLLNRNFAKKHKLPLITLPSPLRFTNVDGTANTAGPVTQKFVGHFRINSHEFPTELYVADCGRDDIILGMPWLIQYNPHIDWVQGKVRFDAKYLRAEQRLWEYHQRPSGNPRRHLTAFLHGDIHPEWNPSATIRRLIIGDTPIARTTVSTQLAVEAGSKAADDKATVAIPDYLKTYHQVFEKKAAERMPKPRAWDHPIDLRPDFKPRDCKLYPLSPLKMQELRKFIDENLAKGYIRPSTSPMASPFFFVDKKDGSMRPVQDYRYLNSGTIKNVYPLPLINDLIDQLQGAKYFTKLDVRAGYNNVRIKDGDQWKAAFKTPLGLYEPIVMFFGLCNAPATFQAMMNDGFKDMIAEGWLVIYMDDILIHSKTQDVHHR